MIIIETSESSSSDKIKYIVGNDGISEWHFYSEEEYQIGQKVFITIK